MKTLALIMMLLGSCVCSALASEVEDDFARANSIFEASVSLLGSNDTRAAAGLRQSATMFEAIALEHGIESSDVLTNAANARLLAGDTGRAIALYHRALRLDPGDANAQANLAVARQRASADASIDRSAGVLDTLTAWRRALAPRTRAAITVGAWAAMWLWAALRVGGVRIAPWTLTALPCALVATLGAVTLGADASVSSGAPPVGVVVVSETIGRTGPDDVAYDPSFTKPLPEGAEFVVVDTRAGWVRGRLGDGRETWVRAADIEVVGS